jgi:protein O-mannosyl-transferase
MVLYEPVLFHDFVNYDDPDYVTENYHVQRGLAWDGVCWAFTTGHTGNWHPVTWLSHLLDCQLYGLKPGGHHFTNAFLHVLNTILLFLLLNRMTGARWRSALVAALFALHPLHIESVAWVAERKDVLCTFFWLLTLWMYFGYVEALKSSRTPARRYYIAALVFFVLALMSKPMAVTLPFVLLLLDYWPLKRLGIDLSSPEFKRVRPILLEKVPFFLLIIPPAVITFAVQKDVGAVATVEALPLGIRVTNAVASYVCYGFKAFWPFDLAVFYPYTKAWPTWSVAGAVLLLGLACVLAIRTSRRWPYVPVGWLWYIGTLVPVIGLVQVGSQAMADRYTYLPLIGLFVILAWGAGDLAALGAGRKLVSIVISGFAIAGCFVVSRIQLNHWKDSEALFRHAIKVTDNNYVAYSNLGLALASQGKIQEAIDNLLTAMRILKGLGAKAETPERLNNLGSLYFKAGKTEEAMGCFCRALEINPNSADTHNNLGILMAMRGELPAASKQFALALSLKPDCADAENNLGKVLMRQGNEAEAEKRLLTALRIKPFFPDAHLNLGLLFLSQKRTQEAKAQFVAALELNPGIAAAHYQLGLALSREENYEEAVTHFALALKTEPDNVAVLCELAVAYGKQGKLDEAAAELKRALALEPADASLHCNLGNTLALQGKLDDAAAEYLSALRISPGFAEAHFNLGSVLIDQGKRAEGIDHCTEALRLKPDYSQARRKLQTLGATPGH